ncbi:phosphoribosyltransferase [Spongiactinospora sp. 9N601]|uniref:phosphoribosyltransferase n=1 Tax=Spongiactinospora sp. 9N601 TaxID=3375149 RepID=UPI00378DD72A
MITKRIYQHKRIWSLSNERFEAAVALLAEHERRNAPTLLVGIARGGVRLAHHLAARLQIPATFIMARHNPDDTIESPATGHVTVTDTPTIDPTARILLVDDICGSGATLATVTALLAVPSTRTATLCRNVGAAHHPDAWVWDVADWTVFPWETAPPDVSPRPLPYPHRIRTRSGP